MHSPDMENSQVPFYEKLNYEELVKNCPYFALKSGDHTSESTEGNVLSEAPLSKSKKKRLKKKQKALSNESDKTAAQILVERASETDHSGSCKLPCKVDKVELTSSKDTDLSKSASNSKSPKMSSKSNFPPTKGQGSQTPKARVPDVVDGEILCPNIKVVKSQVLAEREEKKKLKQLAKAKKVAFVAGTGTIQFKTLDINACNESKPRVNLPSNEIKKFEVPSVEQSSKDVNKEKSREEVLAEREAKKRAKQMVKQKKGSLTVDTVPVSSAMQSSSDILPTVNETKEANVSGNLANKEIIVAEPEKSKAELRAERRAKQEAQRAAKEAEKKLKTEIKESNKENTIKTPKTPKPLPPPEKKDNSEIKILAKSKAVGQQRIKLLSHLHAVAKPPQAQIIQNVHPSVVKLGEKYASRIVSGSNARCVALLHCLKEVITDYVTPAEKEFSRGLESNIAELATYLNSCRPMSVSMTNALRHIKSHLTQLPNNISDDEARRKLLDVIDTFIREQIDVAGEAICEMVKKKIANGDVILIYSCSSLLLRILIESHWSGREFSVIVVDGGPHYEGREMLRRLMDAGLSCTYVQVSAVSFIMRQATKVLLGAHALLANGCVMSRAGAAMIALAAHTCNVPVLVCCETYKFCERVQTDAFVYNELGESDEVAKDDKRLSNWESISSLSLLSLMYDITPPDLVTAVVTELAILPCTSVPVILRVKPSDLIS